MAYKEYVIKNKNGYSVKVLNLGGIIKEINMPDKKGQISNVVLSYDAIGAYADNPCYFGAIIGRTSGRIHRGQFKINDVVYTVPTVDRGNGLHGGLKGLDKRVWDVEAIPRGLKLTYFSPDMEEGYPGNVHFEVTYLLSDENELEIFYRATTDQDTLINLTNHTYFSLNNKKRILDQTLYVNADQFFELNDQAIPTGKLLSVQGTPFDFRQAKKIASGINSDHAQIQIGAGYDQPWQLNHGPSKKASLYDENTGRKVDFYSDQNDVVIYSYNFPKAGDESQIGLALEFQNDPDGINHKNFESSILKKGDVYKQKTVYKFEVVQT